MTSSASPTRVCFVSTGLSTGGAEMMLLKLVSRFAADGISASVISLRDHGPIGPRIEALGIPVHALGIGHGRNPLAAGRELRALLRRLRPDLVQGWMYHGNLAASAARMFGAGEWPVLWSVRQSLYDLGREKPGTAAVIRMGGWLSRRGCRAIIYNSRVAAGQHEALGYAAERTVVIPNGFDTDRFAPDPALRTAMRAALAVGPDTLVVGMVARYHPMKNHGNFFRAAGRLAAQGRDVHVVLVGRGLDASNQPLQARLREYGLNGSVSLLGERADMERVLPSLDVACLPSSWGEGFPNAVGEAMACAVPCVVTDVGDSAYLVERTGYVVPPDDSDALAEALASLQDMGDGRRRTLGDAARQRIMDKFSLGAVVAQYTVLYHEVAQQDAWRRRS
jgi:glycosyltransferase involved in cell wall biosynthesis